MMEKIYEIDFIMEKIKIYEIDFAALNPEGKSKFILDLGFLASYCFMDCPFETAINAQLLIFTRWWNSYRLMIPENPTPQIMDIIMEKLWDYQEGKLEPSEFTYFAKCLEAVVFEIATGSTEKMDEDEAYYDFKAKYFEDWDDCYDSFLIDFSYICYEIREHELAWSNVEDIIDGDIADLKIPLLEGMEEDSNCTAFAQKKWTQQIYSTPRFCQVIALLQKDIKTALEGKPMEELRKVYQNEYLFSPEDCAKVTADWY